MDPKKNDRSASDALIACGESSRIDGRGEQLDAVSDRVRSS